MQVQISIHIMQSLTWSWHSYGAHTYYPCQLLHLCIRENAMALVKISNVLNRMERDQFYHDKPSTLENSSIVLPKPQVYSWIFSYSDGFLFLLHIDVLWYFHNGISAMRGRGHRFYGPSLHKYTWRFSIPCCLNWALLALALSLGWLYSYRPVFYP